MRGQVFWCTQQLTACLVHAQLQDRWEKVQEAQPHRKHMIGCLLGKDSIALWRFDSYEVCKHTDELPFAWDRHNLGYQVRCMGRTTALGIVKGPPRVEADSKPSNLI